VTLLRVMIVDDSPARRHLLTTLVEGTHLATVVGSAIDGSEALKLAPTLKPDVITLDLEMPRINGFGFLRVLMQLHPTVVIVVSSQSQRENVFRALELGALDFIAVPEGGVTSEVQETLSRKFSSIRAVKREHLGSLLPPPEPIQQPKPPRRVLEGSGRPQFLVAIGASTGGPSALTRVLSRYERVADVAFVIAQHMPGSFTGAFAQRLDRYSRLQIREARDGDPVVAGEALVCPGSSCMEVMPGPRPWVRLRPPHPDERFVPSADHLFASVAEAYGTRAIGVVLTGMGDDGAEGSRKISRAGGTIIVESEQSAIVYGMPRAAARAVTQCESLMLDDIPAAIARNCTARP
jgi:two-component system, chemotaxis family, protein-glutamate methylesterase/glutaminase